MTYQITLTLSEEEYAAVAAAAQSSGRPVEELVHEAVATQFKPHSAPGQQLSATSDYPLSEYLYSVGFALNVPTGKLDTPEEEAEDEEVARLLSRGKSLTEMIIEDRGPY